MVLCLNPCCSGRWSLTWDAEKKMIVNLKVLILVVVDNGLVHSTRQSAIMSIQCLNPCCSGQWSRTLLQSGLIKN